MNKDHESVNSEESQRLDESYLRQEIEQMKLFCQDNQSRMLRIDQLLDPNNNNNNKQRSYDLNQENEQLRHEHQLMVSALEQLQAQYEQKADQYDCLKLEYDEYQSLTQNIINNEEEYQRRICDLEEEIQNKNEFQQEFLTRLSKNEEIFQQRYRDIKEQYTQQIDDQRRFFEAQISELKSEISFIKGQYAPQQTELRIRTDMNNTSNVQRNKSYSNYIQDGNKLPYYLGQNSQSSTKSNKNRTVTESSEQENREISKILSKEGSYKDQQIRTTAKPNIKRYY